MRCIDELKEPVDMCTVCYVLFQMTSGPRVRVQTDVASASGLLCQLVFCVQNLVAGGEHVARSDSEKSSEARGL